MKIVIQKGMALHETVEVVIDIELMADWGLVKEAHAKLDERFLEMNKRVIDANDKMNKMAPEVKHLMVGIWEEICGMPASPPLVKREDREGEDA